MKRQLFILIIVSAFYFPVKAQETFARVNLSRTAVYPGEPFQLTFKVFTSTYFLSPVSFEDFHLPSAFTVRFSRTLSSNEIVNGKKYFTLQFFFQVYPVEPGILEIPAVKLSFDSPPEGDYKGKRHNVATESARVTIRPIPKDSPVNPWFPANNVLLSEKWQNLNREPRVGDVIEREVQVRAYGTLPNFIPELLFERSPGIEVYPKSPDLLDKRTDEQANGWRIQKVLYLLTREGEVVIPPLEVNWFNPLTRKENIARVESRSVNVLPNPDLGILATVKDSLSLNSSSDQTIIGADTEHYDYHRSAILAGLVLLVLFIFFRLINPVKKYLKRKNQKQLAYRQSAAWYYKQIILRKTDSPVQLVNSINKWWDVARKGRQPAAVRVALEGTDKLDVWLKLQKLDSMPGKEELHSILLLLKRSLRKRKRNSGNFNINY